MKKVILLIALFLTYTINLIAAYPPYLHEAIDKTESEIAYKIYVPGKKLSDGTYSAAQIHSVYRVPESEFVPNAFHLKTKKVEDIGDGNLTLTSSVLMTSLNELSIEEIKPAVNLPVRSKQKGTKEEELSRIYEIHFNSGEDVYKVCFDLLSNPEVEYAVPIYKRYLHHIPDDTQFPYQYALENIKAKEAWEITKGDPDIVIAIVDTGVDYLHEDLGANAWINPGEIPGNGVDDEGNGFVDDVYGWDFVGNVSTSEALNKQWKEDNDPRNAKQSHGTHVAGCASAATNNLKGIAGTGYNCRLMSVKCASDQEYVGGIWRGYDGIVYAASNGAHIINCSWGGSGYSAVEQDVINYALSKGSVVVASAGNDGINIDKRITFPACYQNVLCVGATTEADTLADFTNRGRLVTVYAPGDNILSTLPGNMYGKLSGTSMSSPIVSGIAGLVLSSHPEWMTGSSTPEERVKRVIRQIRSTSDNVIAKTMSERHLYYGRANAYKAVDYNRAESNKKIAGFEISGLRFYDADAITSYEKTKLILSIKNYLGYADNVFLRITPISNFVTFTDFELDIGSLGELETKDFEIEIQLKDNNPWMIGAADLFLTVAHDEYVDYQIIQVPIHIGSKNAYSICCIIPDALAFTCYGAVSPSANNLWAAGFLKNGGPSLFLVDGNSVNIIGLQKNIFCVDALDNKNALCGAGVETGVCEVYKTIDGGKNWTSSSVEAITNIVTGIKMFDENYCCLIGEQKSGKFGIGYSSNGGTNWSLVTYAPPPMAGESVFINGSTWFENKGWFGTNKGRILFTSNRGRNWDLVSIQKASNIYLLGFKDEHNGIAIYNETNSGDALVASSSNGGLTWVPNRYNFTNDGIVPVSVYSPPDSKEIYVVGSFGQVYSTNDNGASWKPVLSQMQADIHQATGFANEYGKIKLWQIGKPIISTLQFDYTPASAKKELTSISGTTVNFDTVMLSSSSTKSVQIKNTGTVPVNISNVEIVPGEAVPDGVFVISNTAPSSIEPDNTATLRIKFSPDIVGERTASLKITNDGDPEILSVKLTGSGKEASSVEDFEKYYSARISPNPIRDQALLELSIPKEANYSIELIDGLGNVQFSVFNGYLERGTYKYALSFNSALTGSGLYFLRISDGESSALKKIVLVK
ncbi:MAG: S8 family serine peptidase [Ignavibacteria bacterium]|nr:S8 family serine peptidase [Ignavibacteria bacterium]